MVLQTWYVNLSPSLTQCSSRRMLNVEQKEHLTLLDAAMDLCAHTSEKLPEIDVPSFLVLFSLGHHCYTFESH